MLLFNILEKIISDRPRTAPGNAYPNDVNIVNIFDRLDLYWLSTKRIKSKNITIIELETADINIELTVYVVNSTNLYEPILSTTLNKIKIKGIKKPNTIGKKLNKYGRICFF
tara:strand:+ start:901 stop:1236 length:336 start_codon:yes stop_codon:yes gene_type:complete